MRFARPARTATFAVAALVLSVAPAAAQATTSPAARSSNSAAKEIKTGTYDIELAIGGGVLTGTLDISPAGDSLSAKIAVGDHAPPPVRRIKRTGSNLTIEAGGDGVLVLYDLTFDGDAVSGKFTFNGDPGLVSGKRRK